MPAIYMIVNTNNLSALRTGVKLGPHSEETKAKIAAAHRGKPKPPLSEAHKMAISVASKGRVM